MHAPVGVGGAPAPPGLAMADGHGQPVPPAPGDGGSPAQVAATAPGVGGAPAQDSNEPVPDPPLPHIPVASSAIAGMEFWAQISWDELVFHSGITMCEVPRALRSAVASWHKRVCAYIWTQQGTAWEEPGWRLLFSLDLLLFGDLADDKSARSKSRVVADRMALMEAGQWGSLWNILGIPAERRARSAAEDTALTVRKVKSLLEAQELSRAASAAWGSAGGVDASAVVRTLKTTQPDLPGQRVAPSCSAPDPSVVQQVENVVRERFGKFPRKSGVGPGASRYEHWGGPFRG